MLIEILVVLALVLFAAVGMADAAEWLMRLAARGSLPCRLLAVVPVRRGDADRVEMRVRSLLAESCWAAPGMDCRVLLVDCGAGVDEAALCGRLAYAFRAVEFTTPDGLCEKAAESLQMRSCEL